MNRIWTTPVVLATVLILAGCGDGGNEAVSSDGAPDPRATATASPAASAPTPEPGKCDEVKYDAAEGSGTVHPASNFFEPDATNLPTEGDLDHLLLRDNAVVVLYAADTNEKIRERLSIWTYEDVVKRTPVVVPNPEPDALPVRARIAEVELRCNGFDWKRLTAFANRTDIAPLAGHG